MFYSKGVFLVLKGLNFQVVFRKQSGLIGEVWSNGLLFLNSNYSILSVLQAVLLYQRFTVYSILRTSLLLNLKYLFLENYFFVILKSFDLFQLSISFFLWVVFKKMYPRYYFEFLRQIIPTVFCGSLKTMIVCLMRPKHVSHCFLNRA